jgi:hypothetical protein
MNRMRQREISKEVCSGGGIAFGVWMCLQAAVCGANRFRLRELMRSEKWGCAYSGSTCHALSRRRRHGRVAETVPARHVASPAWFPSFSVRWSTHRPTMASGLPTELLIPYQQYADLKERLLLCG